jgi:molybdopterin-guanine dinucleotide biosynthesis protein A
MRHAGFVLVGGRSSRMGRDKALLEWHGAPLVEHVAQAVRQAAGSVVLIGDPSRYGGLGYEVRADDSSGLGPAGGVATALRLGRAEWNLIVACDMPKISTEALRLLLERAETSQANCIVPVASNCELEPLCAVYHSRCLEPLDQAILCNRLKMKDLVVELGADLVAGLEPHGLANFNTPEDCA